MSDIIRIQAVGQRWNPISWGVREKTDSQWCSHIEFVKPELGITLGSRSRGFRYPGGVQIRESKYDHYTRIEQFVLNHDDSPQMLEVAWNWLFSRIGTPYNYLGIVGIATDTTLENPKGMDCSESIFLATWKGPDFPLLSTRPSNMPAKVTPQDLLHSRQIVWIPNFTQGEVKNVSR